MRPSETDKAATECEVDLPRDLRAMADSSQPVCDIETLRDAANEIERLRRVEEDHKNVFKAVLYNEPNGVELVNRLTAYALSQRTQR